MEEIRFASRYFDIDSLGPCTKKAMQSYVGYVYATEPLRYSEQEGIIDYDKSQWLTFYFSLVINARKYPESTPGRYLATHDDSKPFSFEEACGLLSEMTCISKFLIDYFILELHRSRQEFEDLINAIRPELLTKIELDTRPREVKYSAWIIKFLLRKDKCFSNFIPVYLINYGYNDATPWLDADDVLLYKRNLLEYHDHSDKVTAYLEDLGTGITGCKTKKSTK